MHLVLHSLAADAMTVGAVGAVAMALYTVALHYVDCTLIPTSVLPRVRWWSRHRAAVFSMSLVLALLGLALYLST